MVLPGVITLWDCKKEGLGDAGTEKEGRHLYRNLPVPGL